MLTTAEIVRIVIKRLKLSETLKTQWLVRRSIKSTRVHTKREFRAVRRRFMPLINACVVEMNTFIENGNMDEAEDNYYRRVGEAPVDMVFHIVNQHMIEHNEINNVEPVPPKLRRTCTGYFGTSCTSADVAFEEWEQ